MARPPVIGISGRARHGKDSCADFIVARFGGYKYALASPIKAMVNAGFGIDLQNAYWAGRKEAPVAALGGHSPREIMQTLGTEWGRGMVDEQIWITMAKQRLLTNGPGMVIPDVRFDNEADWIRSINGLVVHITRGQAAAVSPHSSEGGITKLPQDFEVANNGSLEDLRNTIWTWEFIGR